MRLSARMSLAASKVTAGSRLADVGTDHGYIPIALVLSGRISRAVAMDVNEGPLERARENIHAYGLDTYISVRLSDGLKELRPGEADTVLIAGMGGPLTARILREGQAVLDTVKELVLQPQSEIDLVRRYLFENGFQIIEEDIAFDGGKYYPMMRAVHGLQEPDGEDDYYYGALELQKSPEVLRKYLWGELNKRERIFASLEPDNERRRTRMRELKEEKERLGRCIRRLDRILGAREGGDGR